MFDTSASTTPLPAPAGSQSESLPHPRSIGWVGTTALAMGGSNQSLFLIGALVVSQGSAAIPLLILGLGLSLMAAPGWTELILMWPNRVGGIASSCTEAFRPYSPVLSTLTGVCYWWGWVPTCGLTAILSATAIHEWYLPSLPITAMATTIVLVFTAVNLAGIRWVTRLAVPVATVSATLAFLSACIPVISGHVNWGRATSFHLLAPFHGWFGDLTSAMAGLYLIGFAAPAFEAAACHVGETVNPTRNVPRAMLASALMAVVYFLILPVVWLGALGSGPLEGNLQQTLGPTFAPLLSSGARAAAIWFIMFNMFHGTLQPLAGAARTLMQLAEDGLIPRILALRSRTDAPWVATFLTAGMAIAFLLIGDPTWIIAAANLAYLIGIAMPNVAVWLLRRDHPTMTRPYRAPRGAIVLGLISAMAWTFATIFGFEQFGLPTVLTGLGLCYSAAFLYALRRWDERRRAGVPKFAILRSLHVKLTGAMLAVLALDGGGYLLAVSSVGRGQAALVAGLEDIFVAVALLTLTVGLVLPGMIAHAAGEVARSADSLATGTLADLLKAMEALSRGDLEGAHARADTLPVTVATRDEIGMMATSFNTMQDEVARAAVALDGAREGLRTALSQVQGANERLQAIIQASPLAIIYLTSDGIVEGWNRAAERTFGWTEQEMRGKPLMLVFTHGGDTALGTARRIQSGVALNDVEVHLQRRDGQPFDISISTAPLHGEQGDVAGIMAVVIDITERKRAEEALAHQALYDSLTGLPNRFLLRQRLETAILDSWRHQPPLALFFIDLDRFKDVNDTYGHHVGDMLLQLIARRFEREIRGADTVARLGGDEFAVLLPHTDEQQAIVVAQRIVESLDQPVDLEDNMFHIGASVGISLSPQHGVDASALMSRADVAMYVTKQNGSGFTVYSPELDERNLERITLGRELRAAMGLGQLHLHYQPQIHISTGLIECAEVLMRWHHPQRGFVSPDQFIPVAEENGLIRSLTTWVLQEALQQCALWKEGGREQRVAVNLSARVLHEPDLVDTVAGALRESGISPANLIVEITESAIVVDPKRALDTLTALHEMGIEVAIDDFGIGYSSLAYLKRLPVSQIKIDRSFVMDMLTNPDNAFIVQAIIDLAHNLGLRVVAEGAENAATFDALVPLECDLAQGYYISRPLPADEYERWLDKEVNTAATA